MQRVVLLSVLFLAGFTLSAIASPLAPYASLTSNGVATYGHRLKPCPDTSVVGVRAYPGSLCLTVGKLGPGIMLVKLTTSAPTKTVINWFAAHLKGWTLTKSTEMTGTSYYFTPPGEQVTPMTVSFAANRFVDVHKVKTYQAPEYKLNFKLPWRPVTVVTIQYTTSH